MTRLLCFGLGYSAAALAHRLAPQGWSIAGTSRSTGGAARLAAQGFDGLVRVGRRRARSARSGAWKPKTPGCKPPPELPFAEAKLSPMATSFYGDNRRVRNCRIRRELAVRLIYPDYRQGLSVLAEKLKRSTITP